MAGILDKYNTLMGHNQYGDVLPVLEYIPELKGFIFRWRIYRLYFYLPATNGCKYRFNECAR